MRRLAFVLLAGCGPLENTPDGTDTEAATVSTGSTADTRDDPGATSQAPNDSSGNATSTSTTSTTSTSTTSTTSTGESTSTNESSEGTADGGTTGECVPIDDPGPRGFECFVDPGDERCGCIDPQGTWYPNQDPAFCDCAEYPPGVCWCGEGCDDCPPDAPCTPWPDATCAP